MMKLFGLSLLMAGIATSAFATQVTAPEIDAGSAASALALLSGGLLILRSRRKK
jgi:LPXTG-motif cell wall-anchored protein